MRSLVLVSVIRARPIMLNLNLNSDSAHDVKLSSAPAASFDDNDVDTVFADDADVSRFQREHLSDRRQYTKPNTVSGFYANSTVTPEYMLELYEMLSKSATEHNGEIIRSFKNIPYPGK